jgi:hypothetical protein
MEMTIVEQYQHLRDTEFPAEDKSEVRTQDAE